MIRCVRDPDNPPRNQLAEHPRVTKYLGLYNMSQALHALPEPGGLLDQAATVYAFFGIFAAAEAEETRRQTKRD